MFYHEVKEHMSPSAHDTWHRSKSSFIQSYFELKKGPETAAMKFGTQVHALIEHGMLKVKKQFDQNEMGLRHEAGNGLYYFGKPDSFQSKPVKNTVEFVDYKTGKNARYADTKQLDLLAGAVFTHFPKVLEIKSALLFVVSNEMVKKEHEFMMQSSYLNSMEPELARLEAAMKSNVWNPNAGPLCKFCPVTDCAHNRRG